MSKRSSMKNGAIYRVFHKKCHFGFRKYCEHPVYLKLIFVCSPQQPQQLLLETFYLTYTTSELIDSVALLVHTVSSNLYAGNTKVQHSETTLRFNNLGIEIKMIQ